MPAPDERDVSGPAPPGQSLSSAAVVSAALDVLSESDGPGLSMRSLSARLGVTPGATYRHVSSKDELMRLVAAELGARVGVPPPGSGPWPELLTALITRFTTSMAAYPAVATYVVSHLPTFNGGRVGRAATDLLAKSGLPQEVVDRGVRALLLVVLGALTEAAAGAPVSDTRAELTSAVELAIAGLDIVHRTA